MTKPRSSRRAIPSVEKVLQALAFNALPRPVVVAAVRNELAKLRESPGQACDFAGVLAVIMASLERLNRSRLQPLINATGVIVHTNLGRAPMGPKVIETLAAMAGQYNNLEYDLTEGDRGGRAAYLEYTLSLLCGAQAATVTNNNAAALVLILRHFTAGQRKEVVISRGELVQIGGGFRIPDILESSGAQLQEVGTTNKTSLADYARAVGRQTALILKVHRSNFFMGGFVSSPTTEELAALGRQRRIPLVEDLGSGAVIDTSRVAGVDHEPTAAEVIKRGVDLVCFSGDKLLGGPQAGIIAGKASWVAALKREPFFRALRCDKLILAALQTTVDLYLEETQAHPAHQSVPVLQMLATSNDSLRERASGIVKQLAGFPVRASVGNGKAHAGGGALPRTEIQSVTVDLVADSIPPKDLAARLRRGTPPVIGYISGGRLKLDLRTVFPAQDDGLLRAITSSL